MASLDEPFPREKSYSYSGRSPVLVLLLDFHFVSDFGRAPQNHRNPKREPGKVALAYASGFVSSQKPYKPMLPN